MISMVRKCSAQYLIRIHKFGLELLEMVEEAVAINKKDRNALWQGTIENEVKLAKITFQTISSDEKLLKILVC